MKVLGLSLITNKVITEKSQKGLQVNHASHAEVLQNVELSGKNVLNLVKAFITKENIGKYLEELPDVSYEFAGKRDKKYVFPLPEVRSFFYILSISTVAACVVFNVLKKR